MVDTLSSNGTKVTLALVIALVSSTTILSWQASETKHAILSVVIAQGNEIKQQGAEVRELRRDIAFYLDAAREVIPELKALPPFPRN